MTQLRAKWMRLPALGGLLGIAALLAARFARRGPERPRPTGQELMRMSDAEFAAFIQSSGIQTVTTAGLESREGSAN
ncbi:MAG TPA: hypothetical protein VMQ65_09050 [Candidatus Limnocylindria bacterium]|nr:hypothetical protein [Candidatus Limnocylindria bacterium]